MALTRYSPRRARAVSPWRELEDMSDRLTRIFDDNWRTRSPGDGSWLPAVNVEETTEELVLTAELPGLSEDDIEVEIENNVLSISGQKSEVREERDDRRYHLVERSYGSFNRAFTLPRTVSADRIEARFKDGVLHVHMPKVDEAKGRRVTVQGEK